MRRGGRMVAGAVLAILLVLAALGGIFALLSLRTVDQREVGVVVRMGKAQENELYAGWYIILPVINKVVKYPLTEQYIDIETDPLTSEGLEYTLKLRVTYRVIPEKADDIYTRFGTNYVPILEAKVIDTIKSVSRELSVNQLADKNGIATLRGQSEEKLSETFRGLGFELTDFNIITVIFPQEVQKAIEEKIKAMQEAQKYQYLVEKEKLEAQRKIEEARGIAEANKIIADSLRQNPEYIQWYYMQVLEKFAESQNNAIILVPVPSSYYHNVNITQPLTAPMIMPTDVSGGSSG